MFERRLHLFKRLPSFIGRHSHDDYLKGANEVTCIGSELGFEGSGVKDLRSLELLFLKKLFELGDEPVSMA